MTLIEKLSAIQQEIKAPKNLYNSYGKYKYRNAEGILEAVKPFEDKYKVAFMVFDDVVQIGERFYVKAEARILDCESNAVLSTKAYAREADEKKGMDASQITGTASSYARKYALNGLLLLDDTKDADTDEFHEQTKKGEDKLTPAQVQTLKTMLAERKKTIKGACEYYKVKKLEDLSIDQFRDLMNMMQGKANER